MLNAEKYRREIQKIRKDDKNVGIYRKSGKLFACDPYNDDNIPCKICLMHDGVRDCENALVDWLLEEYKEPIKLSKFEYDFLKMLKDEMEYITRNQDGTLCLHTQRPTKSAITWVSYYFYEFPNWLFTTKLLEFIKCEDKEPYKIKDILENCEVIENEQ